MRPRSAALPLSVGGVQSASEERSSSNSSSNIGADFNSASSDDEVQSLVGAEHSPLPLQFRTSPPQGAHRPMRSLSPPPKLFLAEEFVPANAITTCLQLQQHGALSVANGNAASSPRKRHRHAQRAHKIQRPCLDFEKMQQVRFLLLYFNVIKLNPKIRKRLYCYTTSVLYCAHNNRQMNKEKYIY